MLELFLNFLQWNSTSSDPVPVDFRRIDSIKDAYAGSNLISFPLVHERDIHYYSQSTGAEITDDAGGGQLFRASQEEGLSGQGHPQSVKPAPGLALNSPSAAVKRKPVKGKPTNYAVKALPSMANPGSLPQRDTHGPNPSTPEPLASALNAMVSPELTWPVPECLIGQYDQTNDYLWMEYDINTKMSDEELLPSILGSLDPPGEVFTFSPGCESKAFEDFVEEPDSRLPSKTSNPENQLAPVEISEQVLPKGPENPPTGQEGSMEPLTATGSSTSSTLHKKKSITASETSDISGMNSVAKYILLVSRYSTKPSSGEYHGYSKFTFDDFDDFRKNFESWLRSEFREPPFCWDTMEFLNDLRKARLRDIDEVIDDLRGSFIHYRSKEASLYLVAKKKTKGKGRKRLSRVVEFWRNL
ncbi:hypothetical protein ABW19_dt0203226 [Dactylella cylindrospora]|nr:hypothetical protein ABW19_dt0203226 [Dactylella cylindrospora]